MCQYKVDYMKSFNFWLLVVKISLTSLIVVGERHNYLRDQESSFISYWANKIAIILMVILEKKEINWLTFLSWNIVRKSE